MTIPRHRTPPRTTLLRSLGLAAILGGAISGPALSAAPDPALATAGLAPASVSGITRLRGGLDQPVYLTHAFDQRLFVVEQPGRIRILKRIGDTWRITSTFLDLRGKVSTGQEQGLLGLAFHPDYATNGRFYVNHTNRSGDTVVAEYRRATAGKANPNSRRLVLTVNQPYPNHNGGWIGFWDENLYIALGDGGSGGDPLGNGQNKSTRLGKILRINPLDPDGAGPKRFSIPADNPFVGKTGLDEIWSYGLRNPWRNSFDRLTGDLWVADVGQLKYEEVNRDGNGRGTNFGWDRLEGKHLYPSGTLCSTTCRTLPIVEYRHIVPGTNNCAVVGGYVSRRPGAALHGRYIYGDTCSGRIWDIPAGFSGGAIDPPLDTPLYLTSFGEGMDGTLYVLDIYGGIHRVNGS